MTYEYVGNLHMHTPFSDGFGTHEELAQTGLRAGLDFLIVTDHNVWVGGVEGYRYQGERRLLLLVGEEVHDQAREPQKNHLLVFNVDRELAPLAPEPRRLLAAVAEADGLSFFAHPTDPAAPLFDQPDLSWVDWDLDGFTGIELWNFMSEFKVRLKSIPSALYYAYHPTKVAAGPFPETVRRWDELLAAGRRVVAIGGSDAHALQIRAGPLRRVVFPYEFLFRAVNTHVLTTEPLSGDARADRQRLYLSLRRGRCFVGYDLPAPTRGFRFTAQGKDQTVIMGESIPVRHGVTLQVWLPQRADVRLLRDGQVVRELHDQQTVVYIASQPGAYRVEAYLEYAGRRRAWIFSNPIYVMP
ncbi:MAG: CehA/McbA family metallohydrolase [Chloroflexota bacterium]